MSTLYLTEEDVDACLDMPMAIEVIHDCFRALAEGTAHNVPRVRAQAKGIVLHSMSAAADYLGLVGWKQYTTTRHGARFHVGLYDQGNGELIALIEANRLGQLRTGAVTGLAAKLLAAPDASEVGLIGSGWQAESQLAAVAAALPIRRAVCFSRDAKNRETFAEKMSGELGIEIVPVEQSQMAVEGFPIVITATTSRQPVFDGDWLSPGTLVCAMGSNWLEKAEIDVTTIRRAELVVCDSVECCQNEAGDFSAALEQGEFQWARAVELADIVDGNVPGRQRDDSIVIFKSVGMAIEDVALGGKLLEIAKQRGVGTNLSI